MRQQKTEKSVSFRGIDFVRISPSLPSNLPTELNHIYNVLKTLGVKELEIGDNLDLARLLKSALFRVKKMGFDIPANIKCESEFFEKHFNRANRVAGCVEGCNGREPVLYLNTQFQWKNSCSSEQTQTKDSRHIIWHEIGHYLHMKNHGTFDRYSLLSQIQLSPYRYNIIKEQIGNYAAEEGLKETIAEIFARLISGENYNQLDPEVFEIYKEFNGPLPGIRVK